MFVKVLFRNSNVNELIRRNITSVLLFTKKNFKNNNWVNSEPKSRYFIIFGAGLIGYTLFNRQKLLPQVKAASILDGLHGRRSQYNFIADVVEKSAPAVVYIEIKDSRRLDFFTGRPSTVSNGSGFIVKEDGLILTNAHVVASRPHSIVEVRLHNGMIYKGVVEDIDIQSDLATVRINAKSLPTMKLGNSSELRPGEFVVAIGSPLSLSNTVTSGVVSSPNRASQELGLHGKNMEYIQTDAAITFGNSGGPLVNLDGEAIGINSMKVTAGISFAIPIDYVKKFLMKTQDTPKILGNKKKYMGITMLTLTPEILTEMQLRNQKISPDVRYGVLVWKVILGSPAYSGGLKPGDIVIEINKKAVKSAQDIYSILADIKTKTLDMKVIRGGKILSINVEPEDIN
ncbi:serine protease HTRA2, mitochondrial-like isoform X2 [Agrilus planipennis]|uniref:Serine protease HTRA2, mitochondrial n=3 Tax=Agrilus planipennis TaxID=224129 RepID=A0A7F5RJK3_AGRPL|nr:serine protease HTRA2, mitochondrial-like isoform X1 [Agrilus planipennis]XP_025836142.1 serine protease HTRA2, mitochondrial-like isoform X2 [Agrilus planipennis]